MCWVCAVEAFTVVGMVGWGLGTDMTLTDVSAGSWLGMVSVGLRDLQTLAKCPILPHVWHTRRKAGHCLRPPG